MKTKMTGPKLIEHEWYIVDVTGKILGRAATMIAALLDGKYRPDFSPQVDLGAGVIVINCNKIRVTGDKERKKIYKRYSGYPHGQKETTYEKAFEKDPRFIVRHAVKGMLPKNRLAAHMIKRLKLYVGSEHPHVAQQPKEYKI